MSFTSETKTMLCRITHAKECCKRAQLYGMLLFCNVFESSKIKYVTEHSDSAELFCRLVFDVYSAECNHYVTEKKQSGQKSYKMTLNLVDARRIYSDLTTKNSDINREIFVCKNCREAFLRGAFIASGVILNPHKTYHLEVRTDSVDIAEELCALCAECNINVKISNRQNSFFVYAKKSEEIETFLAFIGANKAAFKLMDAKIVSDIRNNINRVGNCEMANLDKTICAAQEQISAIEKLKSAGKLANLGENIVYTAALRTENPEMSVGDLAKIHVPEVSKSCVVHRLSKIISLSKEL
ncbi:MAG: DNA-binding protein WhiA [Clostridia bacterium]|nr:DNA-binding protein WhiA [Clostridia bacterium]